jgi:TonB family protein
MTLTIKDSAEPPALGKPGASSQNCENKPSQTPRSNPVCLELGVTIRSLPTEASGSAQPVREEGRTVIVFDNGAVLRSASNLPVGQTVILSNPNGRDVVCRVVGGRNLPSVKGYIEVEFIEPVSDFWLIHQDAAAPASIAAPPAPAVAPPPPAEPMPPPPASFREAAPAPVPERPASLPSGKGPAFGDIAGLVRMSPSAATSEKKSDPAGTSAELKTAGDSASTARETAKPTWPAASRLSISSELTTISDLTAEKPANPAAQDSSTITTRVPAPSGDFLNKGLLAYSQKTPSSSSGGLSGRTPLLIAGAVLVLAGIGGGMYLMGRGTSPVPATKSAVASQPSAAAPPAANNAPEPVEATQPAAAQEAAQTQPARAEQAQSVTAVAPIPASPAATPSSNVRRAAKSTNAGKQPDLTSSRRPAIPNLKMSSPMAPNQNLTAQGEGGTTATEMAAPDTGGGVPPSGLLSAVVRSSKQPVPPPSVPAPAPPVKTIRDAKLISSTRPVYPLAAKESNIQGSVVVSASIDASGNVVDAKALSGPMFLRQAALDSVRHWKYSPAMIDGRPASSQVTVNVDFRLN